MKCHILVAAVLALNSSVALAQTPLLAVDVNRRGSTDDPDSVPGFLSFTMEGTGASALPSSRTLNGYTITVSPFDDGLDDSAAAGFQNAIGQIDDRDRTLPVNSGDFTYAQIYDDFIFAGTSTGPSGGMDLTISGGALLPNTPYLLAIYAYDRDSTLAPQPRSANWLDANNNDALVLAAAFLGGTAGLPTQNDQYRFTGIALTDNSGTLFLRGRSTTGYDVNGNVQPGVFLNAFEIIEPVPEPSTIALIAMGLSALLLRRHRKVIPGIAVNR